MPVPADHPQSPNDRDDTDDACEVTPRAKPPRQQETGGPAGLEPTRYGDWERRGRCIDF